MVNRLNQTYSTVHCTVRDEVAVVTMHGEYCTVRYCTLTVTYRYKTCQEILSTCPPHPNVHPSSDRRTRLSVSIFFYTRIHKTDIRQLNETLYISVHYAARKFRNIDIIILLVVT